MSSFERFLAVRAGSRKDQKTLRNHEVLGASADARGIRVAWMYPDVLNLHGGRGDLMGIMHIACLLNIPCEIRRVDTLIEEIPFDWADLLFFPSGDLAAVPDIDRALAPRAEAFRAFAERGGMIVAVGSSGAVLAKKTTFHDGAVSEGLGLLDMEVTQRTNSFGDDLWIETADGLEVIATQVTMADVTLGEGQAPFGKIIYGRGNCGDGFEQFAQRLPAAVGRLEGRCATAQHHTDYHRRYGRLRWQHLRRGTPGADERRDSADLHPRHRQQAGFPAQP